MATERKETEPRGLLSGTLNIFGLKLDLGELLASPETVQEQLEELREKLKAAGGKEVLSDEEWRQGAASVTGHIRTHGLLGEREFHVGTFSKPAARRPGRRQPEPEVMEPPVDIFDEPEEIRVIADVPGVSLEDLAIKLEDGTLSIATTPTARRAYRKDLPLEADLEADSLQATCNNGVLEIRLRKRT